MAATEIKAQKFFFSNAFKECCARDVKDLRTEILRRLGPPAKDPREVDSWKFVFPEQLLPSEAPIAPNLSDIDPGAVASYAANLRRLGQKLKRRGVPRISPLALHFYEVQITKETPESPDRILVTIETKTELQSGYIVVQFSGAVGPIASDFVGDELPHRSDIDNPELKAQLQKFQETPPLIIRIGRTPFSPDKPIHLTELGGKEFHISNVMFFDE